MAFDTILNPSLTAFAGIGGAIENQMYYEAAISQAIFENTSLAIDAGLTMVIWPLKKEGWIQSFLLV